MEESGVFYGEYTHTLDKKNRMIIPSKFRETMTDNGMEKFTVTRGLDACLTMFPQNEWRKQEEKFESMPYTKGDVRKYKRLLYSGAVEVEPDKQWRILIPEYLKEYAGLSKDIVIVGVSNRIEIWAKDKWENFYNTSKENYEEIAEGLIEF